MRRIKEKKEKKVLKIIKCAECKKELDRNTEEFITDSKKHYHGECHSIFLTRREHRKDLIDYICDVYQMDAPNMVILTQIKRFQDEYNYSLKSMEMTLRYFHDIEGNRVDAKGIGIIPYVYDDAKSYYIRIKNIGEAAIKAKNNPIETETVKVATKKRRKDKSISIEEL